MYVIVGHRHEYEMHPDDKRLAARAAADARDAAEAMTLREAAAERRKAIKRLRLSGSAEDKARARAIRRTMERRINEL